MQLVNLIISRIINLHFACYIMFCFWSFQFLKKIHDSAYYNIKHANQCINRLGAKCQIIFRDKLTMNARLFEDTCQMKISHLPLPYRLHRAVSTGGMNDPDQSDHNYIATTFITTFPVTRNTWADIYR